MLPKDKIEEQILYWLTTSRNDWGVMQELYKNKRYAWCLFFGHLILEKILKALVVKKTKKLAPKIHSLRLLAEMARIELTEKEWKLLVRATDFNMEARYPDVKLKLHQLATKEYTDLYYGPIISLYKK